MADPVTNNYSLVLPTVGGDTNLWGGILNTSVITALDTILSGALAVSITSSDVALTTAQFQNLLFTLSGALTGNRNLTIPLSPNSATVACAGQFIVDNQTSGAFNVTVKTVASGSTGVVVPQGLRVVLYSDGTHVKYADDSKVYVVGVNGSPNGQLAGTTGTVNNPPFPLAFDYANKKLYLPTTTGDATTTVWNDFIIGGSPLPVALFTQLVIKVVSNTTVTVAAVAVSVTDGAGNYKTVVPPGTGTPINFSTTGANGLDTGSITLATWYYLWVIAKTDGTVACLASTSSTLAGLTLPSGYTYAGRVGVVRTASGVAQLLGSWQLGNEAYWVMGLAQTSALPVMDGGIKGNPTTGSWATVAIGNYVPPTASRILAFVGITSNINSAAVAPSSLYGAVASTTVAPPVVAGGNGTTSRIPFEMQLESTNIYWASDHASGILVSRGWVDNL